MKIQILNKNLDIKNNYSSAHIYNVDEGCNITECYNETLDSGVFVISNIEETKRIKIEPYDIVAIYNDNNELKKYMCVDSYVEMMLSVEPKIYRYEIHLFSETKQLEGTILPNLKITKVWGETRTIWDYINQYMSEYCPKIRKKLGSTYTYDNKFDFSWVGTSSHPSLSNKFNIQCPEMQWNTPTLREVLNDLMMVADCIPILKNGKLDYLDLTQSKLLTNINGINYVTLSRSSEDYVSELQVDLLNVTNNIENVNNTVTKIEYAPITTNDNECVITTKNMVIKTKYPIYKLKSVKIMFPAYVRVSTVGETSTKREWFEQDLMNITSVNNITFSLISEYEEWITKDIKYDGSEPVDFESWKNYQNWSLYYTRGSNEISNIMQENPYFLWYTNILWENLLKKILWTQLSSQGGVTTILSEYCYMFFKIEYETLEGCLFRASKNDNVEHERVVIDNQTNSYVDSYSQGFLEYQKANRLGNEQLQINARYLPTDTLMEIGDVYEDSVIYQCQYQYFKNHIEVNALATKNYILREYFTGVKSKIRSWAIAKGSEALTRHDLIKYYCEFSYSVHNEITGTGYLQDTNIVKYFISPLENYSAEPLKCVYVRTEWTDSSSHEHWYPDSNWVTSYYLFDLVSRVVGNSLVFKFGFEDNYWAGKSYNTLLRGSGSIHIRPNDIYTDSTSGIKLDDDVTFDNKGVPTYQNRYTNDNGENEYIYASFGTGVKIIPDDQYNDPTVGSNWYDSNTNNVTDQSKQFIYALYQRPVIEEKNIESSTANPTYNYQKFAVSKSIKKDSQEITNLSTQFEFSTDTTNICFSKKWLERQQAIATSDNYHNFKIRAYDKSLYNFRNPNELPSDSYVEYNVTLKTFTTNNLTAKIEVHITSISNPVESVAENALNNLLNNNCVYLMNSDNEILIAFNNVPNSNRKIADPETLDGAYVPYFDFYLNILRSRNKNIYDSTNRYLITGKI